MKPGPAVPDPKELDPDSYQLAVALREQFMMLKHIGVRQYARRSHFDPSVVSKSLQCKEIVPTWEFIERLATCAAEDQGLKVPEPEALNRLRQLHANMAESRGSVLQKLELQLAGALMERDEIDLRLKEKAEELERQRDKVAELTELVHESHHKVLPMKIGGAEVVLKSAPQLESQRECAEDQVTLLKGELAVERELRKDADQRCKDFEGLLGGFIAVWGAGEVKPEEAPMEWYRSQLAITDSMLGMERELRQEAENRAAEAEARFRQASEEIDHIRGRYYPPMYSPQRSVPAEPTSSSLDETVLIPRIMPQRVGGE